MKQKKTPQRSKAFPHRGDKRYSIPAEKRKHNVSHRARPSPEASQGEAKAKRKQYNNKRGSPGWLRVNSP